jgi:benzoate membrane transport protein
MTFLGLGAAFWGIVIGLAAYRILHVTGAARADRRT